MSSASSPAKTISAPGTGVVIDIVPLALPMVFTCTRSGICCGLRMPLLMMPVPPVFHSARLILSAMSSNVSFLLRLIVTARSVPRW